MKIKAKFIEEHIMRAVMLLATIALFFFAGSIIYTIVKNGWGAISWEMISTIPGSGFYIGEDGGLLNAIMGSLYIVGASTILGLIISIPVVFYMTVYLTPKSKLGYIARLCFDVLFGIPSIVYGAFAFTIMIYLGMKASLLGGIIVITLLIIPIFIRSMDEVARSFPRGILEAAYSLGATKWETIRVVTRQIMPGIATATLLSIGRAIGDAAAVMLTAGYTDSIPTALEQPAATLPLAVFFQLSSPIAAVQERAYGAAFILTVIVLFISILGRIITNKFSKNRIK